MRRVTRREFLNLGAGATLALGGGPLLTACGEGGGGREPSATPSATATRTPSASPTHTPTGTPTQTPTATPTERVARVAAVRGKDLDAMTRDALDAVGGVRTIVNPGETVFVKPNMVSLPYAAMFNPFLAGACTKPEILIAIAEECLAAGAAEVIIGDGSQMPVFDWRYATIFDGSTNLVAEAERLNSMYQGRVTLACLEVDSPEWVEVPSRTGTGTIAISSLAARADRVISVPVMKTHQWAHVTLSLKNFVGVISLRRHGWSEDRPLGRITLDHRTPAAIAGIYLDVVDAVRPDLAIIDASIGMEGNGPAAGAPVDMKERLGSWLLLASTDLVAADATAVRVMSHDPASVVQLAMGSELGLGEWREESIEIVGERLADLRVEWAPAQTTTARLAPGSRGHYLA